MKLYFSPTSPYVRKVVVVAIEAGLEPVIERIVTNARAPSAAFLAASPLGKVPALQTEDGRLLYDSPVICEYLDSLHAGAPLFPEREPALWQALRQQALADGILDAAVLCLLETVLRPEERRWPEWIDKQWSKVDRGLDALEVEAPAFNDEPLTIGHIAIGCALGWLDYRFAQTDWRQGRPALAAWYNVFATRPSMRVTVPYEAT
jgi:glutathione S-transferase